MVSPTSATATGSRISSRALKNRLARNAVPAVPFISVMATLVLYAARAMRLIPRRVLVCCSVPFLSLGMCSLLSRPVGGLLLFCGVHRRFWPVWFALLFNYAASGAEKSS